jgi:hypothetical protein
MGVWQGVAMDCLKFHLGPPCLPFYALMNINSLTAVSRVARPQGRQLAAVFYPFGHPTPYAYVQK